VVEVGLTDGSCDIVLATRQGQAIRFPEDKVRSMGRAAYGVRGVIHRPSGVFRFSIGHW
jgi:DNA gyrase subunit A